MPKLQKVDFARVLLAPSEFGCDPLLRAWGVVLLFLTCSDRNSVIDMGKHPIEPGVPKLQTYTTGGIQRAEREIERQLLAA